MAFLVMVLSFMFPATGLALTPEEVLVLANRNAARSAGIAGFYMERRKIPKENLVLVWITDEETCSRGAYDKKVVPPVRRFLAAHPHIRAIATIYGLPIRIRGGETRQTTGAAFDSELALVKLEPYRLEHWQPNPFYLGFKDQPPKFPKDDVLMVGRLDGPDTGVVKRMILDGLAAETNGVRGKAYFDARWPKPGNGKKISGYAFYDLSLHKAARHHREKQILPVVLEQSKDLFRPGSAPHAAIYCGWYSLGRYIDAFTWARGAVGYHMASSECATLKGDATTWCKQILENGAAATLGPVAEPYIQAFPVPEVFFNLLTEGVLTLAEAYTVSLPYLSWQMMLVGDPLYRMHIQPNGGF